MTLDQTELRWCPFQAMESYWRNNDVRFRPGTDAPYWVDITSRLNDAGQIRCLDCPDVCNHGVDEGPLTLPDLEQGMLNRMVALQKDTSKAKFKQNGE